MPAKVSKQVKGLLKQCHHGSSHTRIVPDHAMPSCFP
jgi:hypothetical protein